MTRARRLKVDERKRCKAEQRSERASSLLRTKSNNSLPELTKSFLRAPGSKVIVTDIERGNKEAGPMRFLEKRGLALVSPFFMVITFVYAREGNKGRPLIRSVVRCDRAKISRIFPYDRRDSKVVRNERGPVNRDDIFLVPGGHDL